MLRHIRSLARDSVSYSRCRALLISTDSLFQPSTVSTFSARHFSADASKENQIAAKLKDVIAATHVEVEDISGGCGSMYRVLVVSPEFEGLALVKQHRLVQKAIASEIADMHGLTLKTLSEKKFQSMKD